jgi:hypothetical protein
MLNPTIQALRIVAELKAAQITWLQKAFLQFTQYLPA